MILIVTIGLPLLLGVFLPGAVVVIRESVKEQRRDAIRGLERIFDKAPSDEKESLIPSLEFVKFKYFADEAGGLTERSSETGCEKRSKTRDYHWYTWVFAALPLTVIIFAVSAWSVDVLLARPAPSHDMPPLLVWPIVVPSGLLFAPPFVPDDAFGSIWVWALISAFVGGYLVCIRGLFRAVNNFDLSPASFVQAAVRLLFGIALAVIVVLGDRFHHHNLDAAVAKGLVVLVAFIVGFLPEIELRHVFRYGRLHVQYKQDDKAFYRRLKAIPIEIIDGIDLEVRERLADFHIFSVQNLAAANPVMLYVETPFGVYQVMDWVAQAQLCASVGGRSLFQLWRLGIRTIFDLERSVLSCHSTARLRAAIGHALSAHKDDDRVFCGHDPTSGSAPLSDDATLIANVQNRLNDPHVHRLRQLYNLIASLLHEKNMRFACCGAGLACAAGPQRTGAGPGPASADTAHPAKDGQRPPDGPHPATPPASPQPASPPPASPPPASPPPASPTTGGVATSAGAHRPAVHRKEAPKWFERPPGPAWRGRPA